MKAEAEEWRTKMLETAAECDDTLMEKFFDDPSTITEEEIKVAIRKGTLAMKMVPMTCGSSFKNKGVQTLILLISEDPIEEMSLLLYEQLKNKTNVHLIPHNEIPFNKNISFFCKNGKLLGKIGDIDINEISAIYARFDKINIKENISCL